MAHFKDVDYGTTNEERYLVSSDWWNSWCDYVGFTSEAGNGYAHPGPIKNTNLLVPNRSKNL